MQVSDNETMRVNVTLVQHSCLDGVVSIRDGGGGGDGAARRKAATVSDKAAAATAAQDGDLINRVGFFNMTSTFSGGGGGGGFSFNSTRPTVTLELTSRNRTCRVNVQLRVVAVPASSESRGSELVGEREIVPMNDPINRIDRPASVSPSHNYVNRIVTTCISASCSVALLPRHFLEGVLSPFSSHCM